MKPSTATALSVSNLQHTDVPTTVSNDAALVITNEIQVTTPCKDVFAETVGKWLHESGSKMSPTAIINLTAEAANRLAASYEAATRLLWIEPGRIVTEYVATLKADGDGKKVDPFDVLATYPDLRYRASHLRNLSISYELWLKFGGDAGAPKLGIGHFCLVTNAKLDDRKKEKLLRRAVDLNLSTRQLKGEIDTFLGKGKSDDAEPKLSAWADLDVPVAKLNAVVTALISHRPSDRISPETVESLQVLVTNLQDFITTHGA